MNSVRHAGSGVDAAELRHGLRTPLNHIIGYAEMMQEDAEQLQLSEASCNLQEVLAQAQRICDLVQTHPVFSQRSIDDGALDELRRLMHEPVTDLQGAVSNLSKFVELNATSDLVRINTAISELTEFSEFGRYPANPPAAVVQNFERLEISPGVGCLLVVDDDEVNRDVLRRHLERQGYGVEEAADGFEALAVLRGKTFDAVLLDLLMPEMSGLEVLREIKQDYALRDIPVLVISASDELSSVAESIQSGAEDYLVKPFDPILLRARLSATLDRKRFRDQERTKSLELEQVTRALKRSNEDLQRFAYAASHDLQAPLRTITSYLQLLERRLKERLSANELELITFAQEAAKRMSTLIHDLLVYSQATTNRHTLETVDCEALMVAVVSDFKAAVDESHAVITWDRLPTVQAEWIGMRQLLQNLIGNAIKYRGTQPPRIGISVAKQNEFWLFLVEDNGQGISVEYQTKIFEMFQRLHGEETPGSGIGLALCQRIVERLGGRIWVESEVGKGSTFFFNIPVNPSR